MRIFLKYNVQWTKYDRIDILLACVPSQESNPPYNHLVMVIILYPIFFFRTEVDMPVFFFLAFFPLSFFKRHI